MKKIILPLLFLPFLLSGEVVETDLLIVGGNESACAAAIQAARLGVKRIVLVNDIDWFGGQFSAEGVGCLDEWTVVNGKRTNFPRSGIFLEMIRRIRAHNSAKYGKACPGNAFCGTETIEPKAAAEIFENWLDGYTRQVRILRGWEPVKVNAKDGTVTGVAFRRTDQPGQSDSSDLTVNATLTLDSSDWGDVIRLSGAKYGAGPDLKFRFGEASAPETFDEAGIQEMNPISYCVVLRETLGQDAAIPRPAGYDPRSFAALDKIAPWVDSDMSAGIYSPSGNSPYTHRRLVDRWHNGFAPGAEATFLNYPVQDYPLCQLPQRVIDALEKTEQGASKKNIVDLTPTQRRIILDDAKQHALSALYHLQTAVHDRVGDFPQSFRYMRLTDEFGTTDHLPPKPYVREGLRLEALYMLKEQDIRAATREPKWAKVLPTDSAFAFQFNIDFHPTRRKYLTADRNGPWQFVHTKDRGWHTDTDRAVFPLRGLVPVAMDGLLGCGKNIGVSSVVQSALRLHGQMMLIGQSAATLAWISLRDGMQPRQIATDMAKVRELQLKLVRGHGGPGVLLWPWHDVSPDALHFEAVNMLSVCGIWQPEPDDVFFHPEKTVSEKELAALLARLTSSGKSGSSHQPDAPLTFSRLHALLKEMNLPAASGLMDKERADLPLSRTEAAIHLWRALQPGSK